MKRKIVSLVLLLCIISVFGPYAYAQEKINVYIDNEKIDIDVIPKIANGRVLVPMRTIFEELGAQVQWDDNTKTAYAYMDEKNWIEVMVGKPYIVSGAQTLIPLDVPAIAEKGRILVPVRAILEAFNYQVNWDDETKSIIILSKDIEKDNPTKEQTIVSVSSAEELLNSIESNKKIILSPGIYNISAVSDVQNLCVQKQEYWDNTFLGAYTIKNVENMTIEGDAEIVIDDKMGDVLRFENCNDVTLRGLTIGHTTSYEEYQCEGAVTRFLECNNITIDNCNLFGCGAFGVLASSTPNIMISGSKIYDCSYTGIWLTDYSTAVVEKTEFCDSNHTSGFIRADCSLISLVDCNIHDIVCKYFGDFIEINDISERPAVNITNCSFKNNTFAEITNLALTTSVVFNNCTFENNTGNIESNNVIYNDCKFFN